MLFHCMWQDLACLGNRRRVIGQFVASIVSIVSKLLTNLKLSIQEDMLMDGHGQSTRLFLFVKASVSFKLEKSANLQNYIRRIRS